jgi:hypothetical protein
MSVLTNWKESAKNMNWVSWGTEPIVVMVWIQNTDELNGEPWRTEKSVLADWIEYSDCAKCTNKRIQ